ASALFTGEEYAALLAVPNNYDAARSVLVGLGLLPEASSARQFKQVPATKAIIALMLKERSSEAESDNRLANIQEEHRIVLSLALSALRFHLTLNNMRQIYGEETTNLLMEIFTEQATKEAIEQFGKTIDALIAMSPGTPVDFMFLYSVMAFDGVE